MVWKSDGRVKRKAVGVWSGVSNRSPESKGKRGSVVWWKKAMAGAKGKPCECGLVGKSATWVKGKAVGVWSGGEKRWLGQREMCWSVVWWEKAMAGSKGKPLECGLASQSAAQVKGKCAGVWSSKPNRHPGQREMRESVV